MPTRRAVLLAGLGTAGLALAGCSADRHSGTIVSGSFASTYRRGTQTGWSIVYPPGHARARLPVLVTLHGRGGDHTGIYDSLALDRHLADVVGAGAQPFALASVDGGGHDYWHPRRSGDDPAGMMIHEFLPLLAAHGLRTAHIGLLGWSMGGYGTLYLSGLLGAGRVAVAVAESPAIWRHSYQSVQGAFDDAADFDAHCIFGRQHLLRGVPLRIDCGAGDGFAPVTRDLRASISPTPAGGIEPGGHNSAFWRSQATSQLRFVAQHVR